jgi:hypothetical protein
LLAGFDDADVATEIPGTDYLFMGIENFGITQGRGSTQFDPCRASSTASGSERSSYCQ